MSVPAVRMSVAFGDIDQGERILLKFISDRGLELPCWIQPSLVAREYNFGVLHSRGASAISLSLKLRARYLKIIDRRIRYETPKNYSEILVDWKDKYPDIEEIKPKPPEYPEIKFSDVEPLIRKYVLENGGVFPCWVSATGITRHFTLGTAGYHILKRELDARGRVFKKLVLLNSRKSKENPKRHEYFVDELD